MTDWTESPFTACTTRRTLVRVLMLAVAVGWITGCGDAAGPDGPSDTDEGVRDRRDLDGGSGVEAGTDGSGPAPEECAENSDCYDENPCTSDFCEGGHCVHVPNDTVVPEPVVGNCQMESCQDGLLVLVADDDDVPEADGHACTEAWCEGGQVRAEADDTLCDDGNRCNGVEVCDFDVGCRAGVPADFDEDGVADVDDPTPPDIDRDGIIDCADWETCDGLDNDHNGLVDDGPLDDSLGQGCYDGPVDTQGVGACHDGVLTCEAGEVVCRGQEVPGQLELCDGRDNDCDGTVPTDEIASFCRTEVVFGPGDEGLQLMRLEFFTALRAVDVHFNIDTTGSMAGALNALRTSLRTEIVPGVAEVIPEAAFGVSTFEDYPLFNFGSGTDLPFELWQRITTDVEAVQNALSRISLGSGNDIEESGLESLYQVATGGGTRWPRRTTGPSLDPSARHGFIAEVDPPGDIDFYRLDVPTGSFLTIDVDAARVGSSLDPYIELYDGTGLLLGANDDRDGLDPSLSLTLTGTAPYFLKVSGFSTGSTGWYYVEVLIAATPLAPRVGPCSELEVGGDVFAGAGAAIELEGYEAVTPRADPVGCFADCDAEIADERALSWIRSHCFAGGTADCGNGELDEYEECDDSNRDNGDGCSDTCSLETEGVPPFNPLIRFDPALGHGTRGGAGFRESALPIIVHATDARSHVQDDYLAADPGIEAHGTEQTFLELEKLGARIVGIAARSVAEAPVSDERNPPGMAHRTGSNVPACAFDGSEPRERDVGLACNQGTDCFSNECVDGACTRLCDVDECCVGPGGAGRPAPQGGDGLCTLSFEMQGDGSGLTDGIIRGIQALARSATYTVTPVFRDHPGNPRDARCFIQRVEVAEVIQDDSCVPELVLADRDDDGTLESIVNLTPRSRVVYSIEVENRDTQDLDGDLDTMEPCGPPGVYRLTLDVTGDDVVSLASQELVFAIED